MMLAAAAVANKLPLISPYLSLSFFGNLSRLYFNTRSNPFAIMNAPESTISFLLDEDNGEVKIVYAADTKVTNAGTFRLNREDHTVGNLFRMQLLRDSSVRFAGYYHPHPLVYHINLKIQTNNSTVTPVEVLSSCIEDLANETDHLITQFQDSMETWKRENDAEMATQF